MVTIGDLLRLLCLAHHIGKLGCLSGLDEAFGRPSRLQRELLRLSGMHNALDLLADLHAAHHLGEVRSWDE